jgi:probable rRNA maturation factor
MQPTIILSRRVAGLNQPALVDFIVRACRLVKLRGTLTVMITSSREMRSLNLRFRGKSGTTDVLSFPAPASVNGYAGDIAISLDIAVRNARGLGHSVAQEIQILVLHGVLHLAGYDHESDGGEMANKERRLRAKLALPGGLIERSSLRAKNSRRRTARPRT